MRIGVSSYSLSRLIRPGSLSVLDVISAIADMGGEHVEIVPIGFNLTENPELIPQIRERAAQHGLALSNYAIGANFSDLNDEAFEQEIQRVMREVDIANELGVKRMRHDVASNQDRSMAKFMSELPRLAEACRRVADYAAQFGIITSVENHGYYIQASDRVQALVNLVDRPNFRTTVDVGNFMCADEESTAAVKKNIGIASMLHLKDFYLRPSTSEMGEGWFRTEAGHYLRGAIVGHGDIRMRDVLNIVKESGYDGDVSIEFEGMEDCLVGTRLGLEYAKKELRG